MSVKEEVQVGFGVEAIGVCIARRDFPRRQTRDASRCRKRCQSAGRSSKTPRG